jgi:hypothetical protein
MMQPGSPQALMPPGEDWLVRKVQELERRMNELVAHDVLRAAGVETETDLIRILGSLIVTGDLSVPNGSINNDALANPVSGGFGNASYGTPSSSTPISTTATAYATATITVPAGFTKAFVVAASSLSADNASIILMETVIAGSVGPTMSVIADASGWANGSSNYAREVTGLSGSFTVATRCQAGIPGVTGMVTTSALAIFLRS